MGIIQRVPQQRFGIEDRNGNWQTVVIDEGGNVKIGKRIVNPKEPKYADDPNPPVGSNAPKNTGKSPVRVTGSLKTFLYFDQEEHKTVRVTIDGDQITKTPL